MKSRILQILGVAFIATIGMVSCDTDACKDVDCGLYGTCLEGACECDLGYSGATCTTLVRAAFVGNYNTTESCTTGPDSYAVTVTAGSSDLTISIGNLYRAGNFTTGTVNADGGVTIASQAFGDGTISGTATKSGGVLTVIYTVAIAGNSDTCTLTAQ